MKTKVILLLGSALLIQGCATQTPVADKNSLEKAATQVLSETVYYSHLFSSCAALGGEIEVDAISKQQDWLNTNNQLILAADQYYSQQQAASTFDYQGKTLAPAAIKLALESRKRAIDELSLAQRTPANKVKTCEFRLNKINNQTIKLTQNPAIAATEAELLKHLPLNQSPGDIPTLAGGISEVTPGATYFQLVKAHESACAAPYTLTIANQWPREAYAYFCGDAAMEVLTCEWGKCESKKL
ncbi:hypothetical protein [Cellvibrio mixtus]|uniref:hypothetical protein n=1 Tax=Cellvibrio mixtus TaxID=39650 RepID=UPI0005864CB1|nr:hypothetical protein [Cellvibrio mixtus]